MYDLFRLLVFTCIVSASFELSAEEEQKLWTKHVIHEGPRV